MKKIIFLFFTAFTVVSSAQNVLTPEILWDLTRVSGAQISPNGRYALFTETTYDISANKGNADIFLYDFESNTTKQLTNTPTSEFEVQWSNKNSIWFFSTEQDGMQIWKMNPDGSNKVKVSNFTDQEVEGFKVAPDESSIIVLQAVKMKQEVTDIYPDLPKAEVRIEDDLMYRHWDHWSDNKKRHFFLYTMQTENLRTPRMSSQGEDMQPNEPFDAVLPPFGGMEQMCYTPDSKNILYTSKKLTGKAFATSTNSSIYVTSIGLGKSALLTEGRMGYDVNPSVSVNNDLAWLSMARDGFESDKQDIIVRKYNTVEDINLTKGIDLTVADYAWHPDGSKLIFIAAINGTKQLFEVSYPEGVVRQLTTGQHDYVSISVSKDRIVAGKQSMIEPVDLYEIKYSTKKGKLVLSEKRLTQVNEKIMAGLKKPTVEERWIETTDGKKMLTWMIFPPDFDPNKKYPTLLYCQGGPQSPVSQFFSYRWNFMLMASQGYIVVAPNRRGLPGFGQEWNDAISKDWGGQSIKDYLSAIDAAAKEPYVDETRLGAIGASYGGYSVYFLAGKHENRFKTFVSHCGLFNLESWYGTTEELFFANWDIGGPYWEKQNKELYEINSPHKYVDNWNTPILVIHGGNDFRVPESEGMQAFQAAQLRNIKSKYLYFPNEGHWVLKPQNGLVWHREFFKWLDEDLKPE